MATKRQRTDAYPINPEFLKFLCTTRAETLHPPSGIIYIAKREDLVVDVWKGLMKYGFTSVPVLQKTKNRFYGFVDLVDIMKTVVETFGRSKLETDKDFFDVFAKDEIFNKKTVRDIMTYPLSRRNPFHPIIKGFSLFSVMEALAKEPNLERIPIVDEQRNLVNIVTQSQVVSFLSKNLMRLGKAKDKPISQFVIQSAIPRISEDEIALEAFKMMHYNNVSGIAVVDSNDKLVGAISLRDLKLISTDGRMFWRLYQPVRNFLQKHVKEGTQRPAHPVILDKNETIESAINKFEEFHIHRLFLVDDAQKPIGVVALKDILLEIISE